MRPLHSNDARSGHRDGHLAVPSISSSSHMSFCIADEASLDPLPGQGQSALPIHFRNFKKATEPPSKSDRDQLGDEVTSGSPSSSDSIFSQSPVSLLSQAQPSVSRPITPMTLGPSYVGSVGSISSSRRHSLTSSLSEHAIGYDQESTGEPAPSLSLQDSGSVPQLVMPSINMPSRRPFTETGKSLGHLKILLAGKIGIGKTSLLKAIVQTCNHIVHVDAAPHIIEAGPTSSQPGHPPRSSRRGSPSTTAISEVHASTKPYPEWWQELDAPYAPRKRKSSGDNVLERNICFIDTPGYSPESSVMETIASCVDYVESHLSKVSSDDLSDSDLLNMLGGGGGCQVDVVLYLISHRIKPADLEYIRRLVPLTNVIPVLAQAELLSEEQAAACKEEIVRLLASAGIRPFTFTPTAAQEKREHTPVIPYTVSSAMVSDHDIIDASLLMSPDYVPPLIPTDLAFLVEKIFSPDGAAWLRHSAAKKYLQWRELAPRRPRGLYKPLALPVPYHQSASTQLPLVLARRSGARQGRGVTRVQVVDWASELQQSLASERLRCRTVYGGERADWRTAGLDECVRDDTLLIVSNGLGDTSGDSRRLRRGKRRGRSETQRHQDPLGLLQMVANLKASGWLAVEVLSSLSIVGLALWIAKHGWPTRAVGS